MHKYAQHNWASVDWSKPNAIIADEMKVTPSAVAYQRNKELRGSRNHIDWSHVDWSKTDLAIAKEIRCTRNAVRYQRLKRSTPSGFLKRILNWFRRAA